MRQPLLCSLVLLGACGSTRQPQAPPPRVQEWGSMREVLRDGHTEGRVTLASLQGPGSIAVGALEGLAGEVTIVGGQVHLSEIVNGDQIQARALRAGEQAALLVQADVAAWSEERLDAVKGLHDLEEILLAAREARGWDPQLPFPFRIEGEAIVLSLHVLNHSCPIADPDGPAPGRLDAENEQAVLVGFYAEGAGGRLTHFGQRTHVHALLPQVGVSGHLDHVRLAAGARLFLPDTSPTDLE